MQQKRPLGALKADQILGDHSPGPIGNEKIVGRGLPSSERGEKKVTRADTKKGNLCQREPTKKEPASI